jgi:hypothetical protein
VLKKVPESSAGKKNALPLEWLLMAHGFHAGFLSDHV